MEAGKQVNVDVETVYSHTLRPYPSQIAQAEKQYVQYTDNMYFLSPYKTTTQTTVVNCASSDIELYTKPAKAADSSITYGPFENQDAYAEVSD